MFGPDVDDLKKTCQTATAIISLYTDRANTTWRTEFQATEERVDIVFGLCKQQFHTAQLFNTSLCGSHQVAEQEVSELLRFYKDTLFHFQKALLKLRMKELPSSLLQNRELTLLDWISVEKVAEMQKEAFNEIAEMGKVSVYLAKTTIHYTLKFKYFTTLFADLEARLEEVKRICFKKSELLYKIVSFNEELTQYSVELEAYSASSPSAIEEFAKLQEFSNSIQTNLKSSIEYTREMNNTTDFKTVAQEFMLRARQLAVLLDLFGDECNKKTKHLQQVQIMWREHHQGYEGLFTHLATLSDSYKMCLRAYDKMLKEISRRQEVRRRIEGKVSQMQSELDNLVQEEVLAQDRFDKAYSSSLPPTLRAALLIPCQKYIIHQEEDQDLTQTA